MCILIIIGMYVIIYQDVESVGKKIGFTTDKRNFHNVSLGQGQEVVAEQTMEACAHFGHWVILQVTRFNS